MGYITSCVSQIAISGKCKHCDSEMKGRLHNPENVENNIFTFHMLGRFSKLQSQMLKYLLKERGKTM